MRYTQVNFGSNDETLYATLVSSSSAGVVLCPTHPLCRGKGNVTRIGRVAMGLTLHNISPLSIDTAVMKEVSRSFKRL